MSWIIYIVCGLLIVNGYEILKKINFNKSAYEKLSSSKKTMVTLGSISLFVILKFGYNEFTKISDNDSQNEKIIENSIPVEEIEERLKNKSFSETTRGDFSSVKVVIQFKDDYSIYIYQKVVGSPSIGCTAEGNWSIKDNLLYLKVTKSYCGTERYNYINGKYEPDNMKIFNNEHEYRQDNSEYFY